MDYCKENIMVEVISKLDSVTFDGLFDVSNKEEFKEKIYSEFKRLIVENNIHIKEVISYTTRLMRDGETDGVEHYFITSDEAQTKLKEETVLAYTKIGEYEYFATKEKLKDSNFYIIDPRGIKYLKENDFGLNLKTIYISIPDHVREERCKSRSDYETAYKKRCESENEQFTEFEQSMQWDCYIENIDFEISIFKFILFIVENFRNESKDTLFLIVGRTGSGKDLLIKEAKKMINGVED